MVETALDELNAVEGVSVRVRTYSGGVVTSESFLKSASRRDLDGSVFAIPDDCTIEDPAQTMKVKMDAA